MLVRARRLSELAANLPSVQRCGSRRSSSMRRARLELATLSWLSALVAGGAFAPSAVADIDPDLSPPRPRVEAPLVGDDHPGLMEQRRRAGRDDAVRGVLDGRLSALPHGAVALSAGTQSVAPSVPATTPYAEIHTTGTDQVFTLLVDFGPGDYADRTWNGPVHGELADTLRDRDGASPSDSDPAHYEQLLFGAGGASLRSYLEAQSGGKYSIEGAVHGWVGVPYNAAHYGADECAGRDCDDRAAEFVGDAMDAFVADFYARNPAGSLTSTLAPYDRRDRYDSDMDGDFSEPDGYLDRVLLVFAGAGQEATGAADRLASRFGSVAADAVGATGPVQNPLGGHELGSSGLWVDAFSAVPEDVGLGTLVHTYGHELGLADLSDPSGSAAADSSVQFWSPMGGGSRLGAIGRPDAVGLLSEARIHGVGTTAPNLLAVERLQLGWLDDPEVLGVGQAATVRLVADSTVGPAPGGVTAAVVTLGDLPSVTRLGTPAIGDRVFASAVGASSQAVLELPLAGDEGRVSWRQWTDTEAVFDSVRVQALDGSTWDDIAPVVTGRSDWVTRSAPLPYGARAIRFVYATDQVSTGTGVLLDDIQVGTAAAPEGAESGLPPGWTSIGWQASDGTVPAVAPGYYVAERRDLSGYDSALRSAPFVADPRQGSTAVDHFGYEDGILMTFWDGRAADNAISAHPRSGRLLVIDARPTAIDTASGAAAPLGLHPFDAPFGTAWLRGFAVDAYGIALTGELGSDRVRVRAQPPAPTFDDTDPQHASGSAGWPQLPGAGVAMTVVEESATSTTVRFGPPAPAQPPAQP